MRPSRIFDTLNLHLCFGITLKLFCLCTSDPPKSNFALTKDANAYADCEKTKTLSCIGVGDKNCIKDQTCQIFITYLTDLHSATATKRVYFQVIMTNEILGTQVNRYVATGISKDIKMGDDIVVSCIRHNYPSVPLSAYLSYNIPNKLNNEFMNIPQTQLISEEVVDLNGKTYCAFSIPTTITVGPVTESPDADKLHVLVAVGSSNSIQELGYHHHWYTTPKPLNLSLPGLQNIISDSELGRKGGLVGHAIFMIFTFICIIPTSTLIARFLKESHLKRRMCHRKFWFIVHTYGLILGIILVTISLTIITITVGGVFKRTSRKFLYHYYLGFAITALYFIQIVVGVFLYVYIIDSYTRVRNLGSFVHFLNGTLIQILSFIQIFFSPKYLNSFVRFCSVASIALVIWVGMYVSTHLFLTVTLFLSDMKEFKAVAVAVKAKESIAIKKKEEEDAHSSDSGGFVHHPEDDSLLTVILSRDLNDDLVPNSDTDKKTGKKRKKLKRKKPPAPSASNSAALFRSENLKLRSRLKAGKKPPPVPVIAGQRSPTPSLRSRSRNSRSSRKSKKRKKETSQHPHRKQSKKGDALGKRKKKHRKTGSLPKLEITTSQISKSKSKSKSRESKASKRSSRSALAIRSKSSRKSRKSSRKKLTNASASSKSLSLRSRSNKIGSTMPMAMPSRTDSSTSPKVQKSEISSMIKSEAKLSHEEIEPEPEPAKEKIISKASKRDAHDFGEGGVGMIHIVPRTKDLIYDDFPDYDMENTTAAAAKSGKRPRKTKTKETMKDPLRAFTKYPMQICFTREQPKTRTFDLIIVIFFGMSLFMSVVLISFLSPYQGHGEEHCNSHSWMVHFP